jgi:hypothetical protein
MNVGPWLKDRFNQKAEPSRGSHVSTYSAICDVPEETLLWVTALLRTHRREIGTRKGRRAGSERIQGSGVVD